MLNVLKKKKKKVVIWKIILLHFSFPPPLKEDINASLGKSRSERQEINDFMKASEILMQRNAADLGIIRELFQKYGYKPRVKVSTGNIFCNKMCEHKCNFLKRFLVS